MRLSWLLIFAGVFLATADARATDASAYASAWGASMVSCPKHNFTSSNGCLSNCSGASNGKNMMVARAVNSNGAKFCLTYVNSQRNNNSQQPWTEYHLAVGTSDSSCVWLCKPGYGGSECKTSTSGGTVTSTCDATTFTQSTYSGKSNACTDSASKNVSCSTSSVESSVSFLTKSNYYDCSNNPFNGSERTADKKMEHDVVLAITGWTSSGHGAFVQPTVVWAWCQKNKNDGNCKIAISPQKSKTLLCKDGYKPNSAKSDCEAINGYVCQGIKDCSGWSASRFKGSNYNTIVVNEKSGSCTQYRCAGTNQGFAGDPKTTTTCKACTGAFESVSSANGQCIEDTAAKKKAEEEANRKANTFSVAYSCGSGTGAAPNGGSILRGNNYTPANSTCTPPSGHSFAGWTVSGTSDTKAAGSAFKWDYSENKTFTAKYSAGTYSITYNVNGGSNSDANPATYTVTTPTITLGTPTRANSVFGGWYADSGFTSPVTQIAQGSTGDKTFYAKWTCMYGFVANSGNTSCDAAPEPVVYSEPITPPVEETVEETVQEEYTPPTEPVPVIEVTYEDRIVKMYLISKADMTAVGSGKPCWQVDGGPREYKECVHSVIKGRAGIDTTTTVPVMTMK